MVEATQNGAEGLKERVRRFWDSHPCGTQFTHLEWGSNQFFDKVERFRYYTQPFMHGLGEIAGLIKRGYNV